MGTRDLGKLLVATFTVVAGIGGCETAVETEPAGLTAHGFVPATVVLEPAGEGRRFVFAGSVGGHPANLFVEMDAAALEQAVGTELEISGETFFDVSFPAFEGHPEHDGRVLRAWIWGGCAGCDLDASWQGVSGSLRLDAIEDGRLTGHVSIVAEGDVPRTGLRNVSVTVDGTFEVALPAADLPAEPVAEPEPAPVTEPTEPAEPTPSEPAQPKPVEPVPVGPPATPASEVIELTLTPGWGVDLADGQLVHKANFKNSDLYVTAGHPYPKLTPGGATPTEGQPLRWFQSSGGLVQTFDSLHDVPLELPTEADESQSIVSAKPYLGFIVKANLSDAYARVWIQSASEDHVTIQFQLLSPM